mmetsp:Transcript_4222/g.8573  ORF Transcript_4222/g.8573 Transcript_4222/m.8573 type:complete len:425 (-) Transcript_4222:52-1326(-)
MVIDRTVEVGRDIVLGLARSQEIAWNDFGSLVDQLVKRVLSVGSRFTPNNGTSLVIHLETVLVDIFSVRLHVTLLKVGRKAVHVLIVWQNGHRFGVKEVVVPNSNQRQCQGQVFLAIVLEEVLIHGMGTSMHFHPVIKANRQGNGSSNGRPKRITSTDPIPESEHVIGIDTKLGHAFSIGRQGCKVLGNRRLVSLECLEDPRFGRSSVGHGFLRSKGFGGDQKERRFGVASLQNFGNVGTVHVGAEVHLEITLGIRFECLADHDGAQVTSSDSNIDDRVNGLSSVSFPCSTTNLFGKILDARKNIIDFRHDVLAVHQNGRVGLIPQCHVQDGPPFGIVDLFTRKHGLGFSLDILLFCKLVQQGHGFFRHTVLAVIQQNVFKGHAELVEALLVGREQVLHVRVFHGGVMRRKGLPSGRRSQTAHG